MSLLFGFPVCDGCGHAFQPEEKVVILLSGEKLDVHLAKKGSMSCLTRFIRKQAMNARRRFDSEHGLSSQPSISRR